MGKSLGNAIYLIDDEQTITKKIMSALTDTQKIKANDPANPDVCMVYYYHKLVNKQNVNTVCEECKKGTRGCVNCKKELIQKMNEFLNPFREKRKYYESNMNEVDNILKKGTKKAQEESLQTIKEIKKDMKIDYYE